MYKILGADQKGYGPATAERLRRWIKEGWVNAQAKISLKGITDGKPVAEFLELADAFNAALPVTTIPRLAMPDTLKTKTVAGAGLAFALLILFFFDPAQHAFYPRCLLHSTTGLLCPGCGALRAGHQLLHGHFAVAFRFNALLVLALPFPLAIVIRWLAAKTKVPMRSFAPWTGWIWFLLVVVFAFGILRNLPLSPLTWLEP